MAGFYGTPLILTFASGASRFSISSRMFQRADRAEIDPLFPVEDVQVRPPLFCDRQVSL